MNLYSSLIRNLLFPVASWRMGNNFSRDYAELCRTQFRPREELEAIQAERLRSLLAHAFESVSFYRDWAKEHNARPEDFTKPGAIKHLPLLDKGKMREFGTTALTSETVPESDKIPYSTSGSTGEPFAFYVDRSMVGNKIARYFREMTAWGIEPGTRFLKVWGAGRVGTPGREAEQGVFTEHVLRREEMSAFDLEIGRADAILDHMERRHIPVLEAYTSVATFLAGRLADRGQILPALRTVVVSGETMTPEQEDQIGRAFSAKVINAYGSREFGRVAFSSSGGYGLLFSMEDFYAEYLDLDPPDPTGLKRLVLTCFSNRAHPFIRYDTGDLVEPDPEAASPCGRTLPVWKRVAGRLAERVTTPSGRHISVHFLTLLAEDLGEEIRQFQAILDRPDRLTLKLVTTDRFKEETASFLVEKIREHTGPEMTVEVEKVLTIPFTGDGKRPLLRSDV